MVSSLSVGRPTKATHQEAIPTRSIASAGLGQSRIGSATSETPLVAPATAAHPRFDDWAERLCVIT